jgi:hypothetical protein
MKLTVHLIRKLFQRSITTVYSEDQAQALVHALEAVIYPTGVLTQFLASTYGPLCHQQGVCRLQLHPGDYLTASSFLHSARSKRSMHI